MMGAGSVTVSNAVNGGWQVTFNTNGDKSPIQVMYDAGIDVGTSVNGSTSAPTQGAYELEFNDEVTVPLMYNATAAQIQGCFECPAIYQGCSEGQQWCEHRFGRLWQETMPMVSVLPSAAPAIWTKFPSLPSVR